MSATRRSDLCVSTESIAHCFRDARSTRKYVNVDDVTSKS